MKVSVTVPTHRFTDYTQHVALAASNLLTTSSTAPVLKLEFVYRLPLARCAQRFPRKPIKVLYLATSRSAPELASPLSSPAHPRIQRTASEEADVLLDAHLLDLGQLIELGAAEAEHLDELRLGEIAKSQNADDWLVCRLRRANAVESESRRTAGGGVARRSR